ncbi:MAG TPA: GDSL-type esterase/lipase family protein [Anaerolineaceae bacterium]|nr:GDSL-type esterase/lipase family protein [Anaerolineaceae bacterium]
MPECTIVCLGDSITRGLISASFVDQLDQRLAGDGFHFVNAGVNGDLAYNVLVRLDRVIALRPMNVILMIGTNDVVSTMSHYNLFISRMTKLLPRSPTQAWYRENLQKIVSRLKAETNARIALASPPIIGEHLEHRANQRLRDYIAIMQEIAKQEGLAYLPVYERMADYLKSTGTHAGKAHQPRIFMTAELTWRHLIFKESYESISRRKGFTILTDGLHLNESGAKLVADVYEEYLRRQ